MFDDLNKMLMDNLYEGLFVVGPHGEIVYWNRTAEKITGFSPGEVVGALCEENLLMHMDPNGTTMCAGGSCPLNALRSAESDIWQGELFIRHKKGHRLPVSTKIIALRNAEGEFAGTAHLFTDNRQMREAVQGIREAQEMALHDPLTGLGNRGYGEINLERCLVEMERYGFSFGVFFMDVDHFKEINDTYGHDVGDVVLQTVGRTIANSLRASDMVFRWGGEEFLAIILQLAPDQLEVVGNKIRLLVEQSPILTEAGPCRVTISLGATLARSDDTVESLVNRADMLMYESKLHGRNQVTSDFTNPA
ncbi:MAG: sensor domain-containing diguanylate cyclase [Desulfomonile sp.]|nr:sensor domain-containing diguanylate cyclase [Desulfomonile sp.]